MTMKFRDLVSADLAWADARKTSFRRRAFAINLAILILTGASTVVLGFSASASRASYALPIVAVVTLLGGIEAFWNWRSRWVLMEETRYRLNRLRDMMDYYLVTTPRSRDGVGSTGRVLPGAAGHLGRGERAVARWSSCRPGAPRR